MLTPRSTLTRRIVAVVISEESDTVPVQAAALIDGVCQACHQKLSKEATTENRVLIAR